MNARFLRRLVVAIVGLLSSVSLRAATITNGDFENGTLEGWNWSGYTDVVGSPGQHQAYIVNGVPGGSYLASDGGSGTVPGDPAPVWGVSYPEPPDLLFPDGIYAAWYEAGLFWRPISVRAGDVLTFEYTVGGEWGCPDGISNDYAFVSLNAELFFPLCGAGAPLTGPALDLPLYESSFADPMYEFGPQYWRFSYQFPTSGDFLLTFSIVDALDFDPTVNSGLLLDNIQITHVPEPAPLVLLALGVAGLARLRSECRRQRGQP